MIWWEQLWLSKDVQLTNTTQSEFISKESGGTKSIRIWGTREPSNTTFVSKNITIQHWYVVRPRVTCDSIQSSNRRVSRIRDFSDDDPFQLIQMGYDVINR